MPTHDELSFLGVRPKLERMKRYLPVQDVNRRDVLGLVLTSAAAFVLGCDDDGISSSAADAEANGGAGGAAASGGQDGLPVDAGGNGGSGGVNPGDPAAGSGGEGGASGECAPFSQTCKETEANPLGPYYRAGAPFAFELDNPSGAGDVLEVAGRVFDANCITPLEGAIVEVWQADSAGNYDNEDGDPGPGVWSLRGRMKTDACGRYAYRSVVPGRYLDGGEYRPAHIHYRVTHGSKPPFVTQLYFVGDPFNESDSMYKPGLAISIADAGGVKTGEFDVVMT